VRLWSVKGVRVWRLRDLGGPYYSARRYEDEGGMEVDDDGSWAKKSNGRGRVSGGVGELK
jgi:hypothetical protein